MMNSWLEQYQQQLAKQVIAQRLPHALIISGVKGAGKFQLAQWLANGLLCQTLTAQGNACGHCKHCHLFLQQTHPDQLLIELNGATISVDQIRAAGRFLEKTPQLATRQVVMIQDADKMTESAANALLKTLEEPTNNSFLLLLVNDEQRLLPTIVSRCRHIHIRPPVGQALFDAIGQSSEDPYINLSFLAELSDDNLLEQFNQVKQAYQRFILQGDNRLQLLSLLLANEHSPKWLTKIIVDLLRENQQQNSEALWQSYKLVQSLTRKVISLNQFNREYGFEKLLVDIQQLYTDTEYE